MLRLVLLIFFVGLYQITSAQIEQGKVNGTVKNLHGESIPGIAIVLIEENKGAISDEQGFYELILPSTGSYSILITGLGYKKQIHLVHIVAGKTTVFNIHMEEDPKQMEEVVVLGKSESREVSEEPIKINSLSSQTFLAQAMGAEELLKTSTGVIVRQNGGLGSNININLNGLSGQAVRIYYDGIPMNIFGDAFQLNTIPIDALARMDIYKGVLPIDIGTDALGGGINLVPYQKDHDYVKTSYTFGSFNTHRFSFSGNKHLKNNLSFSVLSHFNYSANNYKMRNIRNITEQILSDGSIVPGTDEFINARRFHSAHTSVYIEGALRQTDLKWADKFELVTSYASREDEIQHGAYILRTSVGEAITKNATLSQRVDYKKKFLNDKIDIRYYGIFSFSQNRVEDSTRRIYDWNGNVLQINNAQGAEIFATPTERNGIELGTAHRIIGKYRINSKMEFGLSNFYSYTQIKGKDPVGRRLKIGDETIDPNTVPSVLNQNVFGAEVKGKFLERKLIPVLFFKNYLFNSETIDILQFNATRLPVRQVNADENGYGLALKYELSPSFFVRSSHERAVRMPTIGEIFGNFGSVLPNFELRPENSNNYNVGLQYSKFLTSDRELFLSIDGFIRDQENLIRPQAFGPENIIFINEALVKGSGIEIAGRYSPLRSLLLSGNFTRQSNTIGNSTVQVPNIPNLFFNLESRYTIQNLLPAGNSLQVFWTYFFTDRFSINEVPDFNTANPVFIIPAQNIHNTGIIYQKNDGALSISLNLQNVFNAEVYDNFRIPRPGINYSFKINYSL
ncbi:MAG: TonB-dependent receptor [Cyclobacteriaceae bacterium]